jgi:glycosyltransferase involved in cell wall biosynthesis
MGVSTAPPSHVMEVRSVAAIVDDLAAWVAVVTHPTGIQRVAFGLLETAFERSDLDLWPAVITGSAEEASTPQLIELTRVSLLPVHGMHRRRARLIVLEATRRSVRRVRLPSSIRLRLKARYLRIARDSSQVETVSGARGRRADLVVVPGAFWTGDMAVRLAKLARGGIPVRLIVYDLLPVRHPEWVTRDFGREFGRALDELAPLADRLVTMSGQVAAQLAERYPETAARIVVGVPDLKAHARVLTGAGTTRSSTQVPEPFLLVLGTVAPHKNHRMVLDAWRLARKEPDVADSWLVIAGRPGWKSEGVEGEIRRLASSMQILRLEDVSDTDIEMLYERCVATVNASWSEGFGLPARESVARGIPTLVASSIPRDGLPAGSCRSFDPADPVGLAGLMIDQLRSGRTRRYVQLGSGTGWEPLLSALID